MKFYLYNKKRAYEASPYAVSVDGVKCTYKDSDSVPFIITLEGRVCFGMPGSEHHEILARVGETQSRAEGRFWRRSGALTFWDENLDINRENVNLVVDALRDRIGADEGAIRMFLDCQYEGVDRTGDGLIVELTPAEYLSMNIPARQNTRYFWDLYRKKVKLSGGDDKAAGNGMLSRDIWRHYQNIGEGKAGKVIISESKLRNIISGSIRRALSESTNMGVLYHFTTMMGLYGMAKTGRVQSSGGQKDMSNGKNYISFTRHKTFREGFAAAEGMSDYPVRVEFNMAIVNSMHGVKTEPFEYYSPSRSNIAYKLDNGEEDGVYGDINGYNPRVRDESGKEIYRQEYKAYQDDEYSGYDEPEHEYYNQAEERLITDRKDISTKAITRVDIAYFDPYVEQFYDDDYDEEEPINEIIDSKFAIGGNNYCLGEIIEWVEKLAKLRNSQIPLDRIFVYSNEADFIRQSNNCLSLMQFAQRIKEKFGKVAESVAIKESKLREIISSVIREHLNERGTNLGSLYHFTNVEGLEGIIRSGHFNLSSCQKNISGGKNYMSFTRHKSPIEGFAVAASDLDTTGRDIRIEVSSDVLNSMHGTSIDSYEYYSPEKGKISPARHNPWHESQPWHGIEPDGGEESAKAAYRKAKANSEPWRNDSEYLNQAEERLVSNADSINAEKSIKRIDILVFPWRDSDAWDELYRENLPRERDELYREYLPIFQLANFPLYKKIFIYDNIRDFSWQTDNCIPISKFFEELRYYLEKDNGGGVQRTVAESADGSGIHIKEKNKGKFTATKKRTGKSTEELTHSKNPLTRKRANFARMAKRGWKPLKNGD